MHDEDRRGDAPSPNLATVRVTRAPMPPGTERVRFLGELDGVHTHWSRGTTPCFGTGCRHCRQHLPIEYRGYVAAERWDGTRGVWAPTVVEVTERMYWRLEGTILRGTIWELYREAHGRNKTTCLADLVGEVDPKLLPHRFDIRPVVSRLYHNLPLYWGKKPELGAPLQLPVSVDPNHQPPPKEEEAPRDKLHEEFPRKAGEVFVEYAARIERIRLEREGKA